MYYIYTTNLNSYKKVWFDPFARESPNKGSYKIILNTLNMTIENACGNKNKDDNDNNDNDNDTIDEHIIPTTIGQLNFFKCAIENKFIQYVFTHHERIQQHMIQGLNSRKRSIQDVYHPTLSDGCCRKSTNLYSLPQTFANDPTVHISIQRKI